MATPPAGSESIRKFIILVVHGIGEQLRFEQLEGLATELYKTLRKERPEQPSREPFIQVHAVDHAPRRATEQGWRDAPVAVRWRAPDGHAVEAHFREVYWADLDTHLNFVGLLRFVGWALAVSGVRFFKRAAVGSPASHGMCAPRELGILRQAWLRFTLFLVSLLFIVLLGTIGLFDIALKRLSIRIKTIERGYRVIFDYLGDVKLYQDWFERDDARADTIGEKSRVAIRRRMVRAITQTATEAEAGDIAGYYVFAHSLGTVVAFNALMETELALAAYLTEREWQALPARFKTSVTAALPVRSMPRRPPWLDDAASRASPQTALPRAAISRGALFNKCLGFLTIGSPLDKFAAIWPAIVPVNGQGLPRPIPWINVADVQDIVAGDELELFQPCAGQQTLGGLKWEANFEWADQRWFHRAHTSYWCSHPTQDRLIDALVPWLEGGGFARPDDRIHRWTALSRFYLSLFGTVVLLSWFFAWLVGGAERLLLKMLCSGFDKYPSVISALGQIEQWLRYHQLLGPYRETIIPLMTWLLVAAATLVLVSAILRRIWEVHRFGRTAGGRKIGSGGPI